VKGQEIFNTTYEVNTMSGLAEWKCATCHLVDSDVAGVGPGLYSLSDRAGGRIPGYPAEVYVYHSIITPAQYIVSGYPEGLMPIGYGETLSQQDIYDVAAYILSLNQ
ncbi:MAG TPA: cytochrome c, partial [Aggregatilineales bacterium]|nr:cytochrome c [Aggregatilineales bacterium]